MSSREILFSAAGASGVTPTYIEDVFSTYLYTGNDSTQTINNGIDLASKGGLVWAKCRTQGAGYDHILTDTVRGAGQTLFSNLTDAQNYDITRLSSFNSNGFSLGASYRVNESPQTYCSWTFREQAKFFDVVTGTGGATFNHSLGVTPGMIIIKLTNGTSDWWTVHRSSNGYFRLNLTNAAASTGTPGIASSGAWVNANSTTFSTANFVSSGESFVAYLFAHDAGGFGAAGTDNVISCGSFTANGSGNATVSLGYEPQYLMIKATSTTSDWFVVDVMRGYNQTQSNVLLPNSSVAESNYGSGFFPTATGFQSNTWLSPSVTYIYMAIRRGPMATPTVGTSVFSPIISSASVNTKLTTGFPVDSQWGALRGGDSDNFQVIDRLRKISTDATENNGSYLRTSTTNAERTTATSRSNFWDNTGFRMFSSWAGGNTLFYNFRRAPGFFDQVCYTGNNGVATTQTHNLGVAPELMIIKGRDIAEGWQVYVSSLGNTKYLQLNSDSGEATATNRWNNTSPTSTVFSLGTSSSVNWSTNKYVAYLFASVAGVSKVGSYTGTGSTQTINAGLPTGARFVLIKRTDSTGDWWVWDTARGMVAGTDPRLATNDGLVGIGEINENWVYTATNGFQIVTTDASVNANGGSYIYLAIA